MFIMKVRRLSLGKESQSSLNDETFPRYALIPEYSVKMDFYD
jgi:hypothetical protein